MRSHLDHGEAAKEAAADAKGSSEEKGNQFVLTGNNVNIFVNMLPRLGGLISPGRQVCVWGVRREV